MVKKIYLYQYANISTNQKIVKKHGLSYVYDSTQFVTKSKRISLIKALRHTLEIPITLGASFLFKKFRKKLFDSWKVAFRGMLQVEMYKIFPPEKKIDKAHDAQTVSVKPTNDEILFNEEQIIFFSKLGFNLSLNLDILKQNRNEILNHIHGKKVINLQKNLLPLDAKETEATLRYMLLLGDIDAYQHNDPYFHITTDHNLTQRFHNGGFRTITKKLLIDLGSKLLTFSRNASSKNLVDYQVSDFHAVIREIVKEIFWRCVQINKVPQAIKRNHLFNHDQARELYAPIYATLLENKIIHSCEVSHDFKIAYLKITPHDEVETKK